MINKEKTLNIFGIGGHSKVVIEAAELSGWKIMFVYDDDVSTHGKTVNGRLIKGKISKSVCGNAIIAIGLNKIRRDFCTKLSNATWVTIIHPEAVISKDVELGEGTIVMAGAILQSGTKIGRHCIINTGACIDHDCEIGDFVHVGPNSSLAGNIKIHEGTFIGIGSTISNSVSIGSWSLIGAGSVVVHDLPSDCKAFGVPAKPII
jgi:sugar O-acyltransferase (sialic acid O-acetyltransferase NeuD family)